MNLTKDHIKALRNADAVSFHYSTADGYRVHAHKDVDSGDGFGPVSRIITIEAEGHIETFGGHTGGPKLGQPVSASEVLLSSRYHHEWLTIVDLLHVGDYLHLHFVAGNDSQNLVAKELTHDELHLEVRRPLKNGTTKRMCFYLADRICPLYSSARMVSYR